MKPSTAKALDRAMNAMARPPRPRRRSGFSMAPIILALGLVLGYQLAARLTPMVWGSMLPGGLEQARFFRGWPGLLRAAAVACHRDFFGVMATLIGIGLVGFCLSAFVRPLRIVVWLIAVAVIGLDAGMVYVILRVAAEATILPATM